MIVLEFQTPIKLLPDDQVEELIDEVHIPEAVSPPAISEWVNYEPDEAVAVNEEELVGNDQQQDQQDDRHEDQQDDQQEDKQVD